MRALSPSARTLRRALTWLRRGLTTVAVVVAAATVLGLGLVQHSGRQLLIVTSGSMVPTFGPGDVVLVEKLRQEQLHPGMIVTFQAPGAQELTTHRIVAMHRMPQGVFIQTKGDANPTADPNLSPATSVFGVLTGTVPWVGRWLAFYESDRGRLLILGGPLALIALSQLLNLVRGAGRLRAAHRGTDAPEGDVEVSGTADPAARDTPAPSRGERRALERATALTRRRLLVAALATTVAACSGLGVLIGRHTNAVFTAAASVGDNTVTAAPSFCRGSAYARAVCADDPLSWFRMDEQPVGDPALEYAVGDSGSLGRDALRTSGVALRTATPLAGDDGGAFTFDGITGAAVSARSTALPQAYSLEAWFAAPSSSDGGPLVSLAHVESWSNAGIDTALYLTKNGKVCFGADLGQGGPNVVQSGPGYGYTGTTPVWHHALGTSDGTTIALYVDGALVGTRKADKTQAQLTERLLGLGVSHLAGWPDPPADLFKGSMDEAAFYGRALSETDAAAHYRAGHGA
ncbi:signal peptidase I [Oryzihumus leptocrescens]|uniref:Signal peptidase I n=1 Tax=Oryzihumus leptocrescens TaxID=297536 RepID=A0A542ZNI8_9MICO|nr:signal peptidase I [Oryzihumus leptocrescens]TQL61856.1 signal peptidase I [Oryzihumus leptocrescens]